MFRKAFLLLALLPALGLAQTTVTGTVTWTAPTLDINGNPANVTGYNIYAGTCGTTLTKIASVQAPTVTYTATGFQPATTVCVGVTAVNSAGESAMSNVFTYAAPALPQAVSQPPTGVVVTVK